MDTPTMPLVKIDIIRNVRTPEEIKKLADVVQEVMLEKFNAPAKDRADNIGADKRYQIITQHEPYEMICEDTGLGFERTEKLVFIQIFQQGRSREVKEATMAELAKRLGDECEVPGTDLIISVAANTKEDWSFGMGRAQFITGEL
ncbi:4-oxalocrotonate tautomerase protein [Rutstroemia sp. NJR-2017a BVV2]|nr:4-oxalocrotonate tautomerase protein [Rutstroemia sp. NJR-2017a BVV2]